LIWAGNLGTVGPAKEERMEWPPGTEWPPADAEVRYGRWMALADGAELRTADRGVWRLSVVDCGELVLREGQLIACDPFAVLDDALDGPFIKVPAGRYPVRVTVADVSGKGDGSHLREAYVSLLLGGGPQVRQTLQFGIGVDSGTVCFVDAATVRSAMPHKEKSTGKDAWWDTWHEIMSGYGRPPGADSWATRMADPEHIREGLANIPLPLGQAGENIVLAHSGWGDGGYPVVAGYDDTGAVVAVHIDLYVVAGVSDPVVE
jgi:hypothetical protein